MKLFGYRNDRIFKYYYRRQVQVNLKRLLLIILLLLCLLDLTVTYFVFPVHLTHASMAPFANKESILLFNRFSLGLKKPFQYNQSDAFIYQRPLYQGDVVAFIHPERSQMSIARKLFGFPVYVLSLGWIKLNAREHMVGRILALPGDRIRIDSKTIYLNNRIFVPEWEMTFSDIRVLSSEISARDDIDEIVVPGEHVFVLSDNWDIPLDSRTWGLIPMYLLEGRYSTHLQNAPAPLFQ